MFSTSVNSVNKWFQEPCCRFVMRHYIRKPHVPAQTNLSLIARNVSQLSVLGVNVCRGRIAYTRLASESDQQHWNVTDIGILKVEDKNPRLHPFKLQQQTKEALRQLPLSSCYVTNTVEYSHFSRLTAADRVIYLQEAQLRGLVQGMLSDHAPSRMYFIKEAFTCDMFDLKVNKGSKNLSLCMRLLQEESPGSTLQLYTPPEILESFGRDSEENRVTIAPAIFTSLAFCSQLATDGI